MIIRVLIAVLLVALALEPRAQGLPDLGDASAGALSDQQERTIGNRIMRDVRVDPAYVEDPEVSDYIQSLGARLAAVADGPRRDLDFFVVQDDTINAFALPGGHIGVHSGLILLTQSESELAGVVAHEIAHILQRHMSRAIQGQGRSQWASLAALALAMIAARSGSSSGGQVTEAAIASAGALSIQNQLDYSREHEREADRVGLTLLERAGFDTRAMATFFERMLRANRLNELKGTPAYLRTHPLTSERIADMQDRIEHPSRHNAPTLSMLAADSFEYRIARARLRAAAGSPQEAVTLFRTLLAERTVVRPREEVYGLALALRRARDFDAAWRTLAPLRENAAAYPAFELLAAQLKSDMGRDDEALVIYRTALRAFPRQRSLAYGYAELLVQRGRGREAVAELDERVRLIQDDPRIYELQARAFGLAGRPIAQHRAQAEAYYRRGNLAAAVDQLEIAVKQTRGSDFYEMSIAESRLRELRSALENEKAAEKALKIS